MVETIATMSGGGRGLADERLQEVGEELTRREARLAQVERELPDLEAVEVDASWVAECLADFEAIWDVLTPENRGRLLRAVIERVEVDEPANRVTVHIADVGEALPVSVASSAAEEASA